MYRFLTLACTFACLALTGCDSNDEETPSPLSFEIIASPSTEVLVGEEVVFTTIAIIFGGDITGYSWDLDGDGNEDATGPDARFVYTSEGTFEATLRVTGDGGVTGTASETITVTRENVGPTASFAFAPVEPRAGEEVTFTATASDSDGSVTGYSWDFDRDGAEDANGPVATYTFEEDGGVPVRLTVTDNEGAEFGVTETVMVADRFNSVTVTGITVTDFPFTDPSGQPWDPASGPDVFFALLDEDQNLIASSAAAVDAQEGDLPLALDFTFESTDLSAFYFLLILEEDAEAGTSRRVGSVAARLRQEVDGSYPDSFTFGPEVSGVEGLTFDVNLEWGTNGDGVQPLATTAARAGSDVLRSSVSQ